MNTCDKMNAIHNELTKRIASGTLFIEDAEAIESEARRRYITEAYVGKPTTLVKAEKSLSRIMDILRDNPTADITNSPENKELCNAINKQFGFGETYIVWTRSGMVGANANTGLSADIIMRGANSLLNKRGYGYYDQSHTHVAYIDINNAIAKLMNTPGELMAVILHEIGHNFDNSVYASMILMYTYMAAVDQAVNTDGTIDSLGMMDAMKQISSTTGGGKRIDAYSRTLWDRFAAHFPKLKQIAHGFRTALDTISRGLELALSPAIFLVAPIEILLSPLMQLFTISYRKTEQFSDSFASMYGYGPELASALSKAESVNLNTKLNTPVYKQMTDLALASRYLCQLCMGDHGTPLARLNSNIKYLKREIESNKYPSRVKQEMLAQVSDIEKLRDSYLSGVENGNSFWMTAAVRQFANKICNGRGDYIAKLFGPNFVAESVLYNFESEVRGNLLTSMYESGEIEEVVYDLFMTGIIKESNDL